MDRKNTSLSAQAAQLQRSIQSREQRRYAEKAQRSEAAEAAGEYGAYDGPAAKRLASSSGGRSAAVTKLSELSALASSRPVEVFRCELCQASFPSQAQYQQHLSASVHRKALDRLAEQQLVAQRRAVYHDMTESALGAAAWATAHGGGSGSNRGVSGSGRGGVYPASAAAGGGAGSANVTRGRDGGGGRGPGGRGSIRGGGGDDGVSASVAPRHDVLSHEELVAAATKTDEPLTIGGWAPPAITVKPQTDPLTHHSKTSAPPTSAQSSATVHSSAPATATAGVGMRVQPSSTTTAARPTTAGAGTGGLVGGGSPLFRNALLPTPSSSQREEGGEGLEGERHRNGGVRGGGEGEDEGGGLLGLAYGSDDDSDGEQGQGAADGIGVVVVMPSGSGEVVAGLADEAKEVSGSDNDDDDGSGSLRFTGSFF